MLPAGTKVYVAGSVGKLGRALYAEFARDCKVKATEIDLDIAWLEYVDVRNFEQFDESVRTFDPDVLVNLTVHARGFRQMPHWREALAEYAMDFRAALPRA